MTSGEQLARLDGRHDPAAALTAPGPSAAPRPDPPEAGARPLGEGGPWVSRLAPAAVGPPGPLNGLRVAVKDLMAVQGLRVGVGSRTRAGAPCEARDAAVVARLRAAGATIAGTVALHELAFGVTGVNHQVGFPRHPLDPERAPGGSSSGSAVAVADRSCDLAIGTDTGGSVRIPAATCGVVGYKPSRGRYPLDGVLALAPTLDHVGLLAPSVATVARIDAVLSGAVVARRPAVRVGVDRAALDHAEDEVADAVAAALTALSRAGVELVDVVWPDRARVLAVSTTILFAEAAAVHRRVLDHPGGVGADIRGRLEAGTRITATDYAAADAERAALEVDVRAVLAGLDVVVGPTCGIVAPLVSDVAADATLPARLVAETRLANLTGVPALTLPLPAGGLPIGLQVVAGDDRTLLAVAPGLAAAVASPAS